MLCGANALRVLYQRVLCTRIEQETPGGYFLFYGRRSRRRYSTLIFLSVYGHVGDKHVYAVVLHRLIDSCIHAPSESIAFVSQNQEKYVLGLTRKMLFTSRVMVPPTLPCWYLCCVHQSVPPRCKIHRQNSWFVLSSYVYRSTGTNYGRLCSVKTISQFCGRRSGRVLRPSQAFSALCLKKVSVFYEHSAEEAFVLHTKKELPTCCTYVRHRPSQQLFIDTCGIS